MTSPAPRSNGRAARKNAASSDELPPSRVGARTRADVPPAVLAALQDGTMETATLVETLALDLGMLMRRAIPEMGEAAAEKLDAAAGQGIVKRMEAAGCLVRETLGLRGAHRLADHPSDLVRSWSAYALVRAPSLDLERRLALARPFAMDAHHGVREWVWMALRPAVVAAPLDAIAFLTPWTRETDPRLRRFAVEATRPRGVWCPHVERLKQEPHHALPLLEPLRHEEERYPQDAVANWLNDAAKTQPAWVRSVLERWADEGAPERLLRRAGRSL